MATLTKRQEWTTAAFEQLGRVLAVLPVLAVFVAVWGGLTLLFGVWGAVLGCLPALWLAGVVSYVWPVCLAPNDLIFIQNQDGAARAGETLPKPTQLGGADCRAYELISGGKYR